MLKQILCLFMGFMILGSSFAQVSKNARDYYHKGVALKNQGMAPDAIIMFKKAIALNKNYDSAYVDLASVLAKSGKFDTAIILYKKALLINPNYPGAYLGLGNIYRDAIPEYNLAVANYLKALQYDSRNKETYYSIAWCLNAKKEYDSAIVYAVKALEIDNNYVPGYNELGHAYHASKKYKEAIEQFQKNLAVSVNELPLYYSGLCYLELNDREGALRMLEELKKMKSTMAEGLSRRLEGKPKH